MLSSGRERVASELRDSVDKEMRRLGLLYRIFSRVKSDRSIRDKMDRKNYGSGGRRMQDLIGLRVVLYFSDDCVHVQSLTERMFTRVESVIDLPETDEFGPVRFNMILRLPDWAERECSDGWSTEIADSTFEMQVRSVFSEGWHEVEHDLRYKARADWEGHDDLSRMLNGFLATIETSEWGTLKLFEELAWRHYKARRWDAMLRAKLRLRLLNGFLSPEIFEAIDIDPELQKNLFKLRRADFIRGLLDSGVDFPMTLDNVCHAINRIGRYSDRLLELEPEVLSAVLHNRAKLGASWTADDQSADEILGYGEKGTFG